MRCLIFFLFFSAICHGQNVESVGEKVLKVMESMSQSWKLVTDQKSSVKQGKKTQELVKQLGILAAELKRYPRPTNAARAKIKAARGKRIEKVSMEMAETLALMSSNAPLMSDFASELRKVQKDMTTYNNVFMLYFEPDPSPSKK